MSDVIEDLTYRVVRNDEEQYSIWPADREIPAGWHTVGFEGSREACVAHVDKVWTDMRPLSLRRALAAVAEQGDSGADATTDPGTDPGPDLVTRLSVGEHPVEVVLRPEPSPAVLRRALDEGYLHLRFPETNGGTDLGVRLGEQTDLSTVDLDAGTGSMRLIGELTLDFVAVTCHATVDVATLTGQGHLRRR